MLGVIAWLSIEEWQPAISRVASVAICCRLAAAQEPVVRESVATRLG